ncbi:MAG: hypothetical protein HFF36_02515 [Coprobacillus sp.]|nr:hypothetical protein [Coprobacillus sp.]
MKIILKSILISDDYINGKEYPVWESYIKLPIIGWVKITQNLYNILSNL